MDVNQINAYLQRSNEIIGVRSQAEIDYDNALVSYLESGLNIKQAVAAANKQYPDEALYPRPEHWQALSARYQYLREHKAILTRLGMIK